MKRTILQEGQSYTFSDYFKLPYPTRDVVAEFGYRFRFSQVNLPRKPVEKTDFAKLQAIFYRKLPHISFNSEAAKREFLISPLLLELLDHIDVDIDVEYPLNINDRLKGNIDYIIRSSKNFIVVEAKNADLEKGFTQLAVELIAMDNYVAENSTELLYGAVTIGDMWRFGMLDRPKKLITKSIDAFLVPADLAELFATLLGILE